MIKKLITAFSIIIVCACAKEVSPAPSSEVVESLVVSTRLSNQKVNGFAEDRHGHIWIATFRGLNKYDGHSYHQYFCADDTLGLPDNQVNAILASSDGKLWIATINGVAYYTEKETFHRVGTGGPIVNISTILETRSGQLLLSDGLTLFKYEADTDALRPVIRELGTFGQRTILIDREDRLWVVTDGGWGIACYSTRDWSLLNKFPTPHQVYHINRFGNELWMSGMGGLSILDIGTNQWKPLPKAVSGESRITGGDIDIIFPVDDNSLLLNVIGKGMFLYGKSREEVVFQDDAQFPYDLPGSEISSIFCDHNGNVWFGTTDQGYGVSYRMGSQFNGNKFLNTAFARKTVISLCPDKAGNLWINTQRDGLYCYRTADGTLTPVKVDHLIPDTSVGYIRISQVFCDSRGDLWMLFSDKYRIVRCSWDGKTLRKTADFQTITPLSIAEDDRGRIWAGGFSPVLVCYDPSDGSTSTLPLMENDWTFVPVLVAKEPGRMLAFCFNKPSFEVNTYAMTATPVEVSREDRDILIRRSLFIPTSHLLDSGGDLWLGTVANGLLRQREGVWERIEGVPCQDICAVEEDRQGNIWVSTMKGLGKYDRTVGSFVHYFEEDGIGGDQFTERASCVLPDGTLVFGGTHGITWFNPLDMPAKRTVPLVFEDLSIHNRLVRPSKDGPIDKELCEKPTVTIKDSENAFSISFAALDYSASEHTRYAYMMEGFDRDWVLAGTSHEAYYANLPAGRYRFRVRISNGSHSITETEDSLNIKVLPPWYGTWWAIMLFTLAGAFIIAVLWTAWRHIRRVRKQAARHILEVRRERQKAEEAQAAEKELNRIQMNYFSNVAHEFRTPLTMIAGPAQQLSSSEGIKGSDRQLVDIIRRNSAWMLSLVNQLLDFNRIGNSKLRMKVAKIDIVEPLRDTVDLFRFNADSKGVELVSYGLEDPFTMWVDADKMQKVVMNLLSNALKFTPTGGRVSLGFDVISRADAAARFPLTDADTDGQYACITVSDTGPGIPEDQLEKIFERFYQSEAGIKATGSGIGLYYARVLTTLHHGYIKAGNAPDGGAVLSFVLPVSASSYTEDERTAVAPELQTHELAQSVSPDVPEEEAGKKLIAVVDDDIDIANYLKVLLKPHYKVSLYFDATSALKGMEEQVPDLVISDVVMPGLSGYDLCAKIKEDLQLSHIPVVLVTAKVAVESQVQGLGKGADAYVTKPFQPAYLLALVKSLLENREKLRRQLGSVTSAEEIAPEALSPRDAAFMKELYELMEKELANTDLDIMRISEMMKISRTKFYYKIKGLTGENPSVFFKRYKLNRAADLLKEGKLNMSEIAYMTGFNTLSHFSTSFKKQFGVPPSDYTG